MTITNYEELRTHKGHKFECVLYASGENVALECVTCNQVIIDFDSEGEQ